MIAYSPSIKILVLSGQNDETNARHARTMGAIEFIAKPCDPGEIRELLLKALQISDADVKAGRLSRRYKGAEAAIRALRQKR